MLGDRRRATGPVTSDPRGVTIVIPARVRSALRRGRKRLHPALDARLFRLIRRPRHPQPALVSVVVPIYNVEQYFGACLNSLIRQTYRNLEIIVVDDGSPDGSLAIARSYARWDPRIRVLRQPNQGLGAARNTGLAAATGRYLTFVDSDDLLPRTAISTMVRTLEDTGSDFVVGGLRRFEEGVKPQTPPWVKQTHRRQRLHIRLDDYPDILRNVFAWNKMFDREFFVREVGGFPVSVRYEDQEATAKAYLRGTFDVLNVNVYLWRRRIEGTSITQQKTDPADLADRLEVKGAVSRLMAAEASPAVFQAWMAKAIGFDLRPYLEQIPRTGEEFWLRFREGILGFVEVASDDIWRSVSLVDRYPALCVRDGHRDDAVRFLTRRDERGWCFPTDVQGTVVTLAPSYLDGMEYRPSAALLTLGPADLRLTAKLERWSWRGDDLVLEGHAFITNIAFDEGGGSIEVVAAAGKSRVPLTVEAVPGDHIDRGTNDSWNSHRGSAFRATLRLSSLPAHRPGTVWTIRIQVRIGELVASGTFATRDYRSDASVVPVAADDGAGRWIVGFDKGQGVQLRYSPRGDELLVDEVQVEGERVTILGGADLNRLRVTAKSPARVIESVTATVTDDRRHATTVELPSSLDRPRGRTNWTLSEGSGRHLALGAPTVTDDLHQPVRAYSTPSGTLRLRQLSWSVMVTELVLSAGELRVSGSTSAPGPSEAELISPRAQLRAPVVRTEGSDEFTAVFQLDDASPMDKRAGYDLRFTGVVAGVSAPRWAQIAPSLLSRLPLDLSEGVHAATVHRSREGTLRVRFRQPFEPDERGRLAQRRLQTVFQQRGDLTDAVLFESFAGKNVADSPKALCAELLRRDTGLELYWTVEDLTRPVPAGTTPLLLHSRRWLETLHRARYLVNNNNFPFYFRKQPDQVYLQTWHGTPLKKIGNDVPMTSLSLPYRSLMTREPCYWDYLLAQNPFAAETLPAAFGYGGEVIDLGYPRNDALVTSPPAVRANVRRRLGLAPDTVAVLYAPTWRDSVSTVKGYSFVRYLDTEAVHDAFGDRATVLLRGHSNTLNDRAGDSSGVVDVSEYSDINELYLAADVVITDYSSVMFDFCVTGKPMIFLTPDLAEYRDKTRGFYFDFEEAAPGPLCSTTDEVIEHLGHLDEVRTRYAAAYRRFCARFAPNDDGQAAARVVDLVWR